MKTIVDFFPVRTDMKFLTLSCLVFVRAQTLAQWTSDPTINTPVTTTQGTQYSPLLVTDGARGTIVAWVDGRYGTDFDVYAQRLDSSGVALWAVDGEPITTAEYQQWIQGVVSDDEGGAIIVWADEGGISTDLYAQRISGDGSLMWDSAGVVICGADFEQPTARVVSDGLGGAIVVWEDFRPYPNSDVYAQRIDSNGFTQWTMDGIALSMAAGDQSSAFVLSDGRGGAIFTWKHSPFGTGSEDIYAQRVDSSGTNQWVEGGVLVSGAQSTQAAPRILSDGRSGAIVIWGDLRNGNSDIYAQRLDSLGNLLWALDGVVVCEDMAAQTDHYILSDEEGGAFVSWRDLRGSTNELYAQHIDSSGVVRWTTGGLRVATQLTSPYRPLTVSDRAGGFVIVWNEDNDPGGLHAQRVNQSGLVQWGSEGVTLATGAISWDVPRIESDHLGDVIAIWSKNPTGFDINVYAQQISRNGVLGIVSGVDDEKKLFPSEFTLYQNYPNPFNPSTTIRFGVPQREQVRVEVFNLLGQSAALLMDGEVGPGYLDLSFDARHLASGLYLYRLTAGNFTQTKKLLIIR